MIFAAIFSFVMVHAQPAMEGNWVRSKGNEKYCPQNISVTKTGEGLELKESFPNGSQIFKYGSKPATQNSSATMKSTPQNKSWVPKDYQLETSVKTVIEKDILMSAASWSVSHENSVSTGMKFFSLKDANTLLYRKVVVGLEDKTKMLPEAKVEFDYGNGSVVATYAIECELKKKK